jgi:putative chitinase
MNYLKAFQEQLGLTPDGVIGPKTAKAIMADLGITDKLVFIHLMGQIAHESGLYKNAREDLNYSQAGLLNIFRKYYANQPVLAAKHARKPELIANYVYANRMGNGDVTSGDGWKYRGIFGLQLTGKTNIQTFLKYLGLPLDTDPASLLGNPRNYFLAGKFWFEQNNVNSLCTSTNSDCILKISRKVNIGNTATKAIPHGLEDRMAQTKLIANAIG